MKVDVLRRTVAAAAIGAVVVAAFFAIPRLRATRSPTSVSAGAPTASSARSNPGSASRSSPRANARAFDPGRPSGARSDIPEDVHATIASPRSAAAPIDPSAADPTKNEDEALAPDVDGEPDSEFSHQGPGRYFDQYHGRSGALPQHVKPQDAAVTTVLESPGAYPKLSVWVPSFRVGADESVELNATLLAEGGRPISGASVSFAVAERGASAPPLQGTMAARADGTPGAYLHAFAPPAAGKVVTTYDYAVYAVIDGSNGESTVRTATGAFQVHAVVAKVLEGEASVTQRDGNIVVKLPLEIVVPGNYLFYADLWGPDDQAVAFANEQGAALPPGRHVAELLFGGNVIRDRTVDGPYAIRNVRVRNVTEYPFAEATPIPMLSKTPDWKASSFGQ